MDALDQSLRLFKFIILGTLALISSIVAVAIVVSIIHAMIARPATTPPALTQQRQAEAERNAQLWRNLYTTSQQIQDTPAPPRYTLDQFNRLRDGVSYDTISRMLGDPGTVMSEVNLAGIHTVMIQWSNDNPLDGGLNATFQNGRLIAKAQFGLK